MGPLPGWDPGWCKTVEGNHEGCVVIALCFLIVEWVRQLPQAPAVYVCTTRNSESRINRLCFKLPLLEYFILATGKVTTTKLDSATCLATGFSCDLAWKPHSAPWRECVFVPEAGTSGRSARGRWDGYMADTYLLIEL